MIDNESILELLELQEENERLTEENEVLRNLLVAYLSHEDRQYIRIKYDIDL